MPSRSITQCVVILLQEAIALDDIDNALQDLSFLQGTDEPESTWPFSGPWLSYTFREEINGLLSVDVVDKKWPDHMGSTDSDDEMTIFGAWATSNFGPLTYPGGLNRAVFQCTDGEKLVSLHQSFIRLRISYVFGGNSESLLNPPGYDPELELRFITDAAVKLLSIPGALALYNPGGEALLPRSEALEMYEPSTTMSLPPPDLWSSFRAFEIDGTWTVADCVGIGLIDGIDAELCYPSGTFENAEVFQCLAGLRHYMIYEKPTFIDRDTIDGPGQQLWQALNSEISLGTPPRSVVRFFPQKSKNIPSAVLATSEF